MPVIFERVPVQSDLKWSKIVQNGLKWLFVARPKWRIPVKMKFMMGHAKALSTYNQRS